MGRSGRWQRGGRRFIVVAVTGFVALGGVGGPALAAASSPRAGSGPILPLAVNAPARTTYYVVPPPRNGKQEFLYDIAQLTLGSGSRWIDIYRLNEGRPQPGGGKLTQPELIEPGWVLVLPPDAHGPGVRHGQLPVVVPATATGDPSANGGSPASGSAPSPDSAPAASDSAPAASDAAPAGPDPAAPAIGVSALELIGVGACIGLVVGLPLLSAGRRRSARTRIAGRLLPVGPNRGNNDGDTGSGSRWRQMGLS